MRDEAVSTALETLAARQAVTQARLAQQAAQRAVRKSTPASYPTNLPDKVLMPQQRAVRRETAQDVMRAIQEDYLGSPLLSQRQRLILDNLLTLLQVTRGAHAMSPGDWEAFWSIRDFLHPPPDETLG
jgi:hypothetical protein